MRLPFLLVLLATPAAAEPALVWSQQQPTGTSAVFLAQELRGEPRALFSLPVAPGYVPLATLSPDGAQLAATTLLPGGHPERHGLLWRADLRTGVVRQIDSDVLYMERPIALEGGRTLYMRITRVFEAPPARTRLGELDEVETEVRLLPNDGPARTLHSDRGYGLHFAALAGDEVVLYRVARDEAAFYVLPLKGGKPRRLAAAPHGPFARDFSLSGRTLIFASRSGTSSRASVHTLDLDSGEVHTLVSAENGYPSPLAAPNGLFHVAGAPGEERLLMAGKPPVKLLDGGIPFPLASGGGLLAARRQTPDAQELWLVEARADGAKRKVRTEGFFSVAGIGEAP